MKLIDLIAAIGADVDGDEKIQIFHPGRNWDNYDTFNAGSKLLKPFYDLEVSCLSAIETDVIRVDLDFDEKRATQMSRLIDADKLKEAIEEEKDDNDYMCRLCLESIKEIIDEQPTAFDVGKVVEQLENYLFEKYCIEGDTTIDEIVKGGGAE